MRSRLRGSIVVMLMLGIGVCRADEPTTAEPAKSANKHAANRLAKETSPYLLLHAHNPVDWYPWGEEALAKAKREKKLIFLSIGYSSCYWCHVMERECFMNDQIAKMLNEHFVAIKVDREERPDLDEVYMHALQIYLQLAGSKQGGGWPLSMFLTPDAKPLLGGTYFPPQDKDERPGFLSILNRVNDAWTKEPEKWQNAGEQIAEYVRESLRQRPALEVPLVAEIADSVQAALADQYDEKYGGFGFSEINPQRPKFPEPPNFVYLLSRAKRDAKAKAMLVDTLEKISLGGIRDHLGGGFHRYSTDRYWRVPHFEKMLYDNGQLASVYAEAYALGPREDFKRVVDELLGFVARELTDKQGGFYAALDAETNGQEGQFYVWEPGEANKLLSKGELSLVGPIYGFSAKPNFEEKIIPLLQTPLADSAKQQKLTETELNKRLLPVRQKLLAARDKRERPLTDTKVLSGWNGLMIAGYADAGRVFKNAEYTKTAARAADFVLAKLRTPEGRLLRTYSGGQAKLNGYLDDYALLTHGLIALHRATGDTRWLKAADELTAKQIELFWDERGGGFFYTSEDHEELIARSKLSTDGVTPSGNSQSAANLVYLAGAVNKPDYLEHAEKTINSVAPLLLQSPTNVPQMAVALTGYLAATSDVAKPQSNAKPLAPNKSPPAAKGTKSAPPAKSKPAAK